MTRAPTLSDLAFHSSGIKFPEFLDNKGLQNGFFRYNNPVLIDKHQPEKEKAGAAGKGTGKGASKKSGGDKEDAKDDASETSGKAPSAGAAAKDR